MEATLSTSQMICSHCEELVHRYAVRCPYCQHDLTAPLVAMAELHFASPSSSLQTDPLASKITPLNQDILHKLQAAPTTTAKSTNQAKATASAVKPQVAQESLFKILFSLIALLGGSFFAFFGLILKLFSKNGRLVLEWNAETWPYYLFPALVLLVLGMSMLSHGEQETS